MPKFRATYSQGFTEDYQYWLSTYQKTAARIDRLMYAILEDPFKGIGKPEPLRWGPFKGCWSRRITGEHRLVYKVGHGVINFLQCRYHY